MKHGSHISCSRECRKMWGNELTHSQVGSHFGSWNPNGPLNLHCKGQNSLDWRVSYTIRKILKQRCIKWACMSHLSVLNTSYGWKKGRKSNCEFDSRTLKVYNRPNLLTFKLRATYCWKDLDKDYKFFLNITSIGGVHKKLWAFKVVKVPISRFLIWESGDKMTFGCNPNGQAQRIL